MKTRKLIAGVLACTMIASLISGCGTKSEKTEDGKIRITVANAPDKNTDATAYESWKASADEFMKANPDISIEAETWAYDTQTFVAKAEGGTLPTIYTAPFTENKKIIEFGYSADVTSFLKDNGDYEKLNPSVMKSICDEDGNVKLIPMSLYTLGIIVNMKLMRQAGLVDENDTPLVPHTFEELADMAKTVTEKTGAAGFVFPTTGNGGGWLFSNLGWAYGSDFIKQGSDGKWVADLNNEGAISAMELLKKMKWDYNCMPATTLVANADTMKMVGTDQACFAIGHPGQFNQLSVNYGMDFNDIAMLEIPAGPSAHVSLMGGTYYAIANNATDEQIEAALKYLRFKGITTELTDDTKAEIERAHKSDSENGTVPIGIRDLSIWTDESPVQAFRIETSEKYKNLPTNHIDSYNNKSDDLMFHTEVPVCAQDMYSILDSVIQTVLTEKDSDVKKLLDDANDKFQSDFLNNEQ